VFGAITPEVLSAIEAFFETRGAAVMHEVSPLAGIEPLALLADRGYRPFELSTVLVQEIDGRVDIPPASALPVQMIEDADRDAWVDTSVTGWSEDPALVHIIRPIAEVAGTNRAMVHFMVERDGAPIATGSMGIHDGVALLAGASTIPSGRGIGGAGDVARGAPRM
jgi:hypothetical protein